MTAADDLVARLDLDEKVSLLAGTDWWHTAAVERLGIPALKMSDGPAGVRGAHMSGGPASASFPCGTALGATWDVDLVARIGAALTAELRSKGAQLILAPTVNLHRTPLAGRNFECFSEDPFLTARLAVAYIRGVQAAGAGATVKHFVANDSEFERMTISSEVPERALRELYLVPFEAAVVEAGAWAVMSGYNKVAGTWCSENEELLTTILREEWGFEGLVVSDWFGTHSTEAAAVAGLDLEMPGPPLHRGPLLRTAVDEGRLAESAVDERVRRVLQLVERAGLLEDGGDAATAERWDDDPGRRALLREAAASSIVLLRNAPLDDDSGPLLPLTADALTSIAVIGPTAANASSQGGGSALVSSPYEVSPLDGLTAALGDRIRVVHEQGASIARGPARLDPTRLRAGDGSRGLDVDYFAGRELAGRPVQQEVTRRSWFQWDPQFAPSGAAEWSVRISGTFIAAWSGEHTFTGRTDGGIRLWVGDGVQVDDWEGDERRTVGGALELEAGQEVAFRVEHRPAAYDGRFGLDLRVAEPVPADLAERAAVAAAAADVAVVVVGLDSTWETEGKDRMDLRLPGGQADLVERVVAANPRTVVVVNTGAPVEMDWADRVPAIVQLWYPGQEGGNALADVLLGAVNPGGKLPTTFPRRLHDHPSMLNYPGERGRVHYGEGLFIGYRAFDRMGIQPRFPFGHGLSYTTWSYGPAEVQPTDTGFRISVDVTNTGAVAGDEVVQLYVTDVDATVVRPEKELKGFARLRIDAGATATATFDLDHRAFAFWDPAVHEWVVETGEFEVRVGSSSVDVRAVTSLTWTGA